MKQSNMPARMKTADEALEVNEKRTHREPIVNENGDSSFGTHQLQPIPESDQEKDRRHPVSVSLGLHQDDRLYAPFEGMISLPSEGMISLPSEGVLSLRRQLLGVYREELFFCISIQLTKTTSFWVNEQQARSSNELTAMHSGLTTMDSDDRYKMSGQMKSPVRLQFLDQITLHQLYLLFTALVFLTSRRWDTR